MTQLKDATVRTQAVPQEVTNNKYAERIEQQR